MRPDAGLAGRFTPRSTWALIGALIALVGALALCLDRFHNGDFYLSLVSGRLVAQHGVVDHYPFATIAKGGTWFNQQWLSELAFFRVSQVLGPTGLTLVYALLITAPLALLLWLCRRKGWPMLIAVDGLLLPRPARGHPSARRRLHRRDLLAAGRPPRRRSGAGAPAPGRSAEPRWWVGLAIVVLFALWANLHGGFIAGLLLLGLATIGFAIDHWRGIPGNLPLSRIAALGLVAVLAAVTVTVSTPLGAAIWSYLLSFQNQAISLASTEWESALGDPLALLYLGLATVFAAWMWVSSPRPRRATTLLVTAGFLVFAGYSIRNIVFVGPVLALQVAWTAPNRSPGPLRLPVAVAGSVAAAAALAWAVVLGPARDDPSLGFPVADYAIAHPPATRADRHLRRRRLLHQLALARHSRGAERLARALHSAGAARQLRGPAQRDAGPARRAAAPQGGGGDRARASAIGALEAAGFVPVYSTPQRHLPGAQPPPGRSTMREGRSPDRLSMAAASGGDLMAKPQPYPRLEMSSTIRAGDGVHSRIR